MTKKEAESAIRHLVHQWRDERRLPRPPSMEHIYSFSDFKNWLNSKHYDHYLNFRSAGGADYAAEIWFNQEMKQAWRD